MQAQHWEATNGTLLQPSDHKFEQEKRMEMIRRSFRAAVLMGAATSMLTFASGAKAQNQDSNNNQWWHGKGWSSGNWVPNDNPWPYNKVQGSPVLAEIGRAHV